MIDKTDCKATTRLDWYLVQCKPNAAQIAIKNLENQQFGTFLPLQEATERKGGIFQRRIYPLFPGYLFVRLNACEGPWRQVNNTRGVTRLVCLGAEPSKVPHSIIESLKAQCDKGNVLRRSIELQSSQLQVGDKAQVMKGPFSGFVGLVNDIEPNSRINILLEIMGQTTKVAINAGAIQPIG